MTEPAKMSGGKRDRKTITALPQQQRQQSPYGLLRRRITKARRERIGTDGKERERGGMF